MVPMGRVGSPVMTGNQALFLDPAVEQHELVLRVLVHMGAVDVGPIEVVVLDALEEDDVVLDVQLADAVLVVLGDDRPCRIVRVLRLQGPLLSVWARPVELLTVNRPVRVDQVELLRLDDPQNLPGEQTLEDPELTADGLLRQDLQEVCSRLPHRAVPRAAQPFDDAHSDSPRSGRALYPRRARHPVESVHPTGRAPIPGESHAAIPSLQPAVAGSRSDPPRSTHQCRGSDRFFRLSGPRVSIDRPVSGQPHGRRRRHPDATGRLLRRRQQRRRLEDGRLRTHLATDLRRRADRLGGRPGRLAIASRGDLRRHRRGPPPAGSGRRRRHLQVDQRRRNLDVGRSVRRPTGRPHHRPSDGPGGRLRRRARSSVRPKRGARRVPHAGRRRDLGEGALHRREHRRDPGGVRPDEP